MKTTTMMGIAVAALILSSCSKNETSGPPTTPNDPAVIGFNTYTGSRAVDNIGDTLESTGFNVIALHTDAGAQTFTFQADYKYADGKWGWPTDDVKYKWPTEDTTYPLYFASFYPTAAGLNFTTNKEVAVTIEPEINDQKDYISAYTEVDKIPETGKAPFEFKHILSKIKFKILATAGYTVNIQSVTVVNVHDQNSVTTAPTYDPFTTLDLAWKNPIEGVATATTAYKSYAYRSAAIAQVITESTAVDVVSDGGTLMLMPQYGAPTWSSIDFAAKAKTVLAGYVTALTPWSDVKTNWVADMGTTWNGSRIEVVYNIQKGGAYLVGAVNQFIRVGYDLKLDIAANKWVAGKQYTYTIALGGPATSGGILLDPLYRDASGDLTEIPVDNPKTTPGDPINSMGVIGFNVSVGTWIDAPTTIQ